MSAASSPAACLTHPSARQHLATLTVRFVAASIAAAILWTAGNSATDSSASASAHTAPRALVAHGS